MTLTIPHISSLMLLVIISCITITYICRPTTPLQPCSLKIIRLPQFWQLPPWLQRCCMPSRWDACSISLRRWLRLISRSGQLSEVCMILASRTGILMRLHVSTSLHSQHSWRRSIPIGWRMDGRVILSRESSGVGKVISHFGTGCNISSWWML